jgi:LmbE family N-acetylglucosaminyl deacetylase
MIATMIARMIATSILAPADDVAPLPAEIVGRRILILVPHPDDEVVGCAAAIRRARAHGSDVYALYLTTGVPARAAAWRWRRGAYQPRVSRRRDEARQAAACLQITPLAFSAWPSRELKAHLADARTLVAAQRAAVAADMLWAPAYEGGHQDHDVTSFLASTFAAETPVVEFAEYNAAPGGGTHAFPAATGAEHTIDLPPADAAWKAALLDVYRSERANLAHVRRRAALAREVLRPLGRHDYRRPAHPGLLFYQRYAWVPFRHPRVDFTPPAHVAAAIAAFSDARGDGG